MEKRIIKDGKNHYRARVEVKGHKRISATFIRLTDARLWKQQTEMAIKEGKYFKIAEAKKHTVKELIERYEKEVLPQKPKAKQEQHFRCWKEKIGYLILSDLTAPVIAQYRDELLSGTTNKGSKRSPTTVLRYMSSLSHALSIAKKEWHWLDSNPMQDITKPKSVRGRVRILSAEERRRLLEASKESSCPFLYTIIVLSLITGMRKSETLNIRWQNVDFDKNRIILHETKNGERRAIPLRGHALEVVKKLYMSRNHILPLLFPANGLSDAKPYDISGQHGKIFKTGQITDFRFHDLRHCCASELAAQGASLAQIAEVLGHKTLQMVKRYAHLTEGNIGDVLEHLDRRVFGSAS